MDALVYYADLRFPVACVINWMLEYFILLGKGLSKDLSNDLYHNSQLLPYYLPYFF